MAKHYNWLYDNNEIIIFGCCALDTIIYLVYVMFEILKQIFAFVHTKKVNSIINETTKCSTASTHLGGDKFHNRITKYLKTIFDFDPYSIIRWVVNLICGMKINKKTIFYFCLNVRFSIDGSLMFISWLGRELRVRRKIKSNKFLSHKYGI